MKQEYTIVIPSYKREKTIQEKTLKTLNECNINPQQIDIFVANNKEYRQYKKSLDPTSYNKIIIGVEKIHHQRNYIRNYYKNEQLLFIMDDDIEKFKQLKNNKLHEFKNLDTLIKKGFQLMKKEKIYLMGVYPVDNYFYMDNSISKGLYFIVGCAYWCINQKNPKLMVNVPIKSDYELSIKNYLINGAVLRLNNITVQTKYYKNDGGMNEYRNKENIKRSALYLVKKYPQYIRLNKIRNKIYEIKFKRQKNNTKIKR